MAKLTLATCQFHIDKCLKPNRRAVIQQMMKRAQADNVHLDHFSEACLNGYFGSELKSDREHRNRSHNPQGRPALLGTVSTQGGIH